MQLPTLYYSDRYRNEGTRTYSQHSAYSEADTNYSPTSETPGFEIYPFLVPQQEVTLYQAEIAEPLLRQYLPGDKALFCVHPQMEQQAGSDPYLQKLLAIGTREPALQVIPSSSTRSLYVQDNLTPHCLKVHFPFRVSRYGRKMREEVIEQAVNVSRELGNAIDKMPADFGFLREGLGIAMNNLDDRSARGENWGYLVREMTPYPFLEQSATLVPGFALYGRDYFDPDIPPILTELTELAQGKDILEYVVTQIMQPIIRHWAAAYTTLGYMLEPHGQNVLLAISEKGTVERVIHRDLSVGIDMRLRRDIGLSAEGLNQYNRMESGKFSSISYDMFMGNHFFEQLVAFCRVQAPELRAEDFRQPCREEFVRSFPAYKEYLPPTVHYFTEERDQFNKPLYGDTGRSPLWRP